MSNIQLQKDLSLPLQLNVPHHSQRNTGCFHNLYNKLKISNTIYLRNRNRSKKFFEKKNYAKKIRWRKTDNLRIFVIPVHYCNLLTFKAPITIDMF